MGAMRSVLSFVLGFALLGVAQQAHAGGYVSLGFGSSADVGGELASHFTAEGESSARLAIGHRFPALPIAIEVAYFSTAMQSQSGFTRNDGSYDGKSLGVEVKYHFGLFGPIDGYVRGGLNKTWLGIRGDNPNNLDYSGRGLTLGVGAEYSFGVLPGIDGGVFIDFGRQMTTMHDPARTNAERRSLDGTIDALMIGVSVSAL